MKTLEKYICPFCNSLLIKLIKEYPDQNFYTCKCKGEDSRDNNRNLIWWCWVRSWGKNKWCKWSFNNRKGHFEWKPTNEQPREVKTFIFR